LLFRADGMLNAVMERTAHAAVLPVDFGWSDIGSFDALWKELDHDKEGNSADGPKALINTHNSLVFSDETEPGAREIGFVS
jgi:mannose-1-phosphate guanylyltransferase